MACPFLNLSDSRCAEQLCLTHLADAFQYCFGRHHNCSLYHQLLGQRAGRRLGRSERLPVPDEAAAAAPARLAG